MTTFLGLLLYTGVAALVAAACYRIWRFGKLPELVAAAFTTLATLAISYAITGDNDFNLVALSILFSVAWFSANAVQLVSKKMSDELDA
jgi:hypothetical protein